MSVINELGVFFYNLRPNSTKQCWCNPFPYEKREGVTNNPQNSPNRIKKTKYHFTWFFSYGKRAQCLTIFCNRVQLTHPDLPDFTPPPDPQRGFGSQEIVPAWVLLFRINKRLAGGAEDQSGTSQCRPTQVMAMRGHR